MPIRIACFLLIFAGLALASCGTAEPRTALVTDPLLPLPEGLVFNDPGNGPFMTAIEKYVKDKGGPASSHFEFTRIDLDGDGRREGLAIMTAPHHYWCDFDGCRVAIFQASNHDFRLVSEIEPVRGPLIVSESTTNGWRDLIVNVSGRRGWDAKDVALKFDGASYPAQPAYEPPLRVASALTGVRIFP